MTDPAANNISPAGRCPPIAVEMKIVPTMAVRPSESSLLTRKMIHLWARWGDAVREAGLEPNRLQKAYGEDLLIEKLIGLARELGHFPVATEVKMKAGEMIAFHGTTHLHVLAPNISLQ